MSEKFGIPKAEMAYPGQEFTDDRTNLRFTLKRDGTIWAYAKNVGVEYGGRLSFDDTGAPWIPQWKNFRKAIKQMVREGEFDKLARKKKKADEANKHCRNAAPELYNALVSLQAWITDGGYEDDPDVAYMCGQARAALDKANGEKQ